MSVKTTAMLLTALMLLVSCDSKPSGAKAAPPAPEPPKGVIAYSSYSYGHLTPIKLTGDEFFERFYTIPKTSNGFTIGATYYFSTTHGIVSGTRYGRHVLRDDTGTPVMIVCDPGVE